MEKVEKENHNVDYERLKYFYKHNKEYFEKQREELNFSIGKTINSLENLSSSLELYYNNLLKTNKVLSELENFNGSFEQYLNCLDTIIEDPPKEKLENFDFENLNPKEFVLGYLSNILPIEKYLEVKKFIDLKPDMQ